MPEVRKGGSWRLGDHVSVTYAADDECRDLLTDVVRAGVKAGHRVAVFLDADDTDLARHLTDGTARPGQFTPLRYGTEFGGDGFDIQDMLTGLRQLRDQATADGYPAVTVAGKMTWTLRAGFDTADLVAYESAVNEFFGDGRALALCLYDARRFTRAATVAIGAVHPGPLLRFTVDGWGAHLRLTGELDASNTASLPTILDLVATSDATVLVDASDLLFLDAAGAATIIRFAASRPTRHTVVRCARGVRQVLEIVGAGTVPNLVLRERVGDRSGGV